MSATFGVRYTCLDCAAGFAGETAALLHTLRMAHFDFADTEDSYRVYTPFDDPEFGISLSRDNLPLNCLPSNFVLQWRSTGAMVEAEKLGDLIKSLDLSKSSDQVGHEFLRRLPSATSRSAL
jgi:hypothetical protein